MNGKPPTILAFGFRPFFLLAGLWACVALALWLTAFAGGFQIPTRMALVHWHSHEMLFGFGGAAVAGFCLTAVASWTGRPPLQGRGLLIMVALWAAARLFIAISAITGTAVAAMFDLAFFAALLGFLIRELFNAGNWRNLPIAGALLVFLLGCAASHAEAYGLSLPQGLGWRTGVAVLILLIVLIGGRIVPAFTRNWLAARGVQTLPAPSDRLDMLTMAATLVALAIWVISPDDVASPMMAVAAVLNIARLARWQGHLTLREPLLAVLHLGYAWVPIGFALLSFALVVPGVLPPSAAVHGLTTGAMGTMILAVMTRATRGHTGRPLQAGWATATLYVLVTISAIARVDASLWPDMHMALLHLAGTAWVAAYGGFLGLYGPMLLRPRVDGQPG